MNIQKANKRGNKTYQQNKINKSNLNLGKDALTQIYVNKKKLVFIKNKELNTKPSINQYKLFCGKISINKILLISNGQDK